MDDPDIKLDIEMYGSYGDGYWAQARYLAHGYDDVLWTNSLVTALNFIEQSFINYETLMPTMDDD